MAQNTGERSITVEIVNETTSNFQIVSSDLMMQENDWVKGEMPVVGESLNRFSMMTWAVATNTSNYSVGAEVILTGMGTPITVQFRNNNKGISTCTCSGHAKIVQIDTGSVEHSKFQVELIY